MEAAKRAALRHRKEREMEEQAKVVPRSFAKNSLGWLDYPGIFLPPKKHSWVYYPSVYIDFCFFVVKEVVEK